MIHNYHRRWLNSVLSSSLYFALIFSPLGLIQVLCKLNEYCCCLFYSSFQSADLGELGQNFNNFGNDLNQGLGDMFKDLNNVMDNYEKSMNEASSQATWAWIKLIAMIAGGLLLFCGIILLCCCCLPCCCLAQRRNASQI